MGNSGVQNWGIVLEKTTRRLCIAALLGVAVLVSVFFARFTWADTPLLDMPAWQEAQVVAPSGVVRGFDPAGVPPALEEGEVYRFRTVLGEYGEGAYLFFENDHAELRVVLDHEELLYAAAQADLPYGQMVQIPLPADAAGKTLVLDIRPQGDTVPAVFPPILRVSSEQSESAFEISYANRTGIPAGAMAMVFLAVCGVFLAGVSIRRPDWSTLLLLAAALLLFLRPVAVSCGYYFLPQPVYAALSWPGFSWLAPALLLAYLVLNRRRSFLRLLGRITLWSAGVFLLCVLISFARDSYLSRYLCELAGSIAAGYFDGLLHWLTQYLTAACAAAAIITGFSTISRIRTEAQAIALKGELAMENYRLMKQNIDEAAALHHEAKNQITTLHLMYRQGDLDSLGRYLEQLDQQMSHLAPVHFTNHFMLNAILQSVAARAREMQIQFTTQILVPERLALEETDLCAFFINLFDNALAAAEKVQPPEDREIVCNIHVRQGFLAIRCENSYDGKLCAGEDGRLRSTKPDAKSHGFGLQQMRSIAERYESLLDIAYTDDRFIVQTALKLGKQEANLQSLLPMSPENEKRRCRSANSLRHRPFVSSYFTRKIFIKGYLNNSDQNRFIFLWQAPKIPPEEIKCVCHDLLIKIKFAVVNGKSTFPLLASQKYYPHTRDFL